MAALACCSSSVQDHEERHLPVVATAAVSEREGHGTSQAVPSSSLAIVAVRVVDAPQARQPHGPWDAVASHGTHRFAGWRPGASVSSSVRSLLQVDLDVLTDVGLADGLAQGRPQR